MKRFITNLKKRAMHAVMAILVAVGSVGGGILPLLPPQTVSAAPNTVVTGGFAGLSDWQIDRSTPSGGYILPGSVLTLNVDGDAVPVNAGAFYKTEGLKATLPVGTNMIKATLNVDAAWQNVIGVRAGIWAETVTNPTVYPIIEFSNRNDANDQLPGTPVIRAWDSVTGWTNLISNPVYGQSYTFEIFHNPSTDTFDFYVNNSLLRSVATTYAGVSHGPFSKVIFNSYNSRIANNDYSVVWSNFQTGVYVPNSVPTVSIANPVENGIVSTKQNNSLNVTGIFDDDRAVNYLQLELVKDGNLVTVYYVHYNNAGLNPDGTFSVNIPVAANIAEGAYSLFYTGTDFDGGVTNRMERKFVIDNTKPTKPTITTPTERQWFKSVPITNQWTASTDNIGVVKYQVAYAYADGHAFAGSTCVGEMIGGVNVYCRDETGLSRNHQPALSEQGKVTIWVRAFDQAGNASDWSKSVYYHYDGGVPSTTIAISQVADGKFTVSGVASDNLELNRVYVQLVHRESGVRYGGTTVHLIGTGYNSPWSVEYDTVSLPEGNYAAHASVVDMAGNSGAVGWTENFYIDKTAPVVTVDDIDTITVGEDALVTGTINDPTITEVEVFVDGVSLGTASVVSNAFSFDLVGLSEGSYSVVVKAVDIAGNEGVNSPAKIAVVNAANEEEEENQQPVITGGAPTPLLPITPFVQDNNDTDVLGEQDTNTEQQVAFENDGEADNRAVAGTSDENKDSSDWTAPFGLAWYWWLLILAAVIGGLWWFFAARSRADQE